MFALCVEASHARGMGHLFRALSLAQALEARGAKVQIYVNEDAAAARALQQRGRAWKTVPLVEGTADWETQHIKADGVRVWVDDRLETTAAHAARIKAAGIALVTFDDRGSGAGLADLHIAAMPIGEGKPASAGRVLTGLQYLVLDPAISRHRRVRHTLGSLVVSMGGSDTYGLTVEVVRELQKRRRAATVVVGPGFQHERALAEAVDDTCIVKRSLSSLVEEFSRHDLAITAGGITPFEANAAGLPCIVIAAEPWERRAAAALARLGGCRYAGPREAIDFSVLDEVVPLAAMSAAALAAVPADGASRVAQELLKL